jgi:hypothetical protein
MDKIRYAACQRKQVEPDCYYAKNHVLPSLCLIFSVGIIFE